MKLENNNPVYTIKTYFGQYRPHPAILFDLPFGTNGIGDAQYISESLKSSIERAATAFIKSNFNL